MIYTAEQLAAMCGITRQRFMRAVTDLTTARKFTKRLSGRGFTEGDAQELSQLIGFTIKNIARKKAPKKKVSTKKSKANGHRRNAKNAKRK